MCWERCSMMPASLANLGRDDVHTLMLHATHAQTDACDECLLQSIKRAAGMPNRTLAECSLLLAMHSMRALIACAALLAAHQRIVQMHWQGRQTCVVA